MEEIKPKDGASNVILENDDIDNEFEFIEDKLRNISLNTCYDNTNVNSYIERYKQDDFDVLEDNLNQLLYDFHIDKEYHIYFLDMIRHHVYKDFDDLKIIRDNPIILENIDNMDDKKKHTYIKQNQLTENTFKLYDWGDGMYKKETN